MLLISTVTHCRNPSIGEKALMNRLLKKFVHNFDNKYYCISISIVFLATDPKKILNDQNFWKKVREKEINLKTVRITSFPYKNSFFFKKKGGLMSLLIRNQS